MPSPVVRVELPLPGVGGKKDTIRKGNLCPTFREKVEKSFPRSAVFQLPSIQNNSHAEMANIGMAYLKKKI